MRDTFFLTGYSYFKSAFVEEIVGDRGCQVVFAVGKQVPADKNRNKQFVFHFPWVKSYK